MHRVGEKPAVLVVDDAQDNIVFLNEVLKEEYNVRVATNGKRALEVAHRTLPDIILMDIVMPIMNGYEACRRIKKSEALKDIPVLFLTVKSYDEDEKKGFDLGAADYIVKPVNPSILKARVSTHLELKRSRDILKDQNQFLEEEVRRRIKEISTVQEASIMAMASLAEMRDDETGSHLKRVRFYIKELAEYMGKMKEYRDVLTPERIRLIVLSSPLHDIGKIGIPDEILLKPGPLSSEEYEFMKKHTILGGNAIESAERLIGDARTFLSCTREIAYYHHEKWDGSGYPLGLSGEDIPLPARLMAVVDAYDALTSRRVYKDAVPHEKAVAVIKEDSGKHFDPNVVHAFLKLQKEFKEISKKYKNPLLQKGINFGGPAHGVRGNFREGVNNQCGTSPRKK
ncbi:MAG: two-component system response regulator [Clostridia bacterium]|nr:two-component system response regulator [Clostridia bacterium]